MGREIHAIREVRPRNHQSPGTRSKKKRPVSSIGRATVGNWRFRRLSFQGRVTVANTYFLSKLWHVAPFYLFSDGFFKTIDDLTKKIIWNDSIARVSLEWYRRPKSKGGWNLINPKTQCQALKAKWMARWQVQDSRWKPLFTDLAKSFYGLVTTPSTERFLEAPTRAAVMATAPRNDDAHPAHLSRAAVFDSVKAFAQLDIKRKITPVQGPGLSVVFARDQPVALFTVKLARRFIDARVLRQSIDRPVPGKIHERPPIYRHIRFMAERKPYPRVDHVPLPERQWDRFFAERLHSPHRYTSERHHLYLIAHHVYLTNGIKAMFNYVPRHPSDCRRKCAPAGAPPAYENRGHAFHDCPEVLDLWNACREWAHEMHPDIQLRNDAAQDQLCWPETADIPSIVIHLHATVSQMIFKTYCKLGDGETVPTGVLKGRTMAAFRYRARVEWERARYKDQLRDRDDQRYMLEFTNIWHCPPHISVEPDGVRFGGIWSIPDDAAVDDPEPAMEEDVDDGADDVVDDAVIRHQ